MLSKIMLILSALFLHQFIMPDENEIIKKADARNQGRFLTTTARLVYKDSKGNVLKERKIKTHRIWNDNDNEMLLIKFTEPKDIKNSSFLSVEKAGKTTQKLYLPSFQKVRLIGEASRNSSFMGSDFSYSDMESTNLSGNKNKLLKEDANYYTIEGLLSDKEEFCKRVYKINKANYMVESTLFYKKKCFNPAKESQINKVVNEKGIYLATKIVMITFKECSAEIKSSSEFIIDEYQFLPNIAEEQFSDRNLSNEEY